ncbi:hypothetical protein [Candidatus Solirubrobacter pratensis]|uniref:hypothetical protein n=1 Tax=Candidatus Solirubrobacter pratensis TaxID=1298857 RepID=UPI0012DCC703|nr:hypothetical protein [Candidatus Solirubrobacter pratensis]
MSPRVWVTILVLTGLAVVLLVVPPHRVPDWVIFAVVIADMIAIGLTLGTGGPFGPPWRWRRACAWPGTSTSLGRA